MSVCRKTLFALAALIAVCLTLPGCRRPRQAVLRDDQLALSSTGSVSDIPLKTRVSHPYNKMRVPADLFVDLLQPEDVTDPVSLIVSASTSIVTGSAVLTLRVPDRGGEPAYTVDLWAGTPMDIMNEAVEYAAGPLPAGRYHFVAILEFTPDRNGADPLVLSKSLYVDVRPDKMLCSNVSFRQIDRVELYERLHNRAMENLRPGSTIDAVGTTGRQYEQMTAIDPDLIQREIARLQRDDPDVARQIAALNSTRVRAEPDTGAVQRPRQTGPAQEGAMSVR